MGRDRYTMGRCVDIPWYLGPAGVKSGRSTQAVRHAKQNAFKSKIATQKQKSIEILFCRKMELL
jgi:hypothetical protein